MSKRFTALLLLISIFISPLSAVCRKLSLIDVRNTMEEIFSYHIEVKEMTPTLVKRSFKMFIEQFDPGKIYLTYDEVKPFLELSSTQVESIINHFYNDQYPEFQLVNAMIAKSIERARQLRKEFYIDFMKDGDALQISLSESSSQYPFTLEELKERLRFQMFRMFLMENRFHASNFWTNERKKKICALFEKRFAHYENKYLSSHEDNDPFFATHILKSMARGLDAHTAFFSPDEAFEIRSSLEKQFEGIGVVLREGLDGVEIFSLIKEGPAARSGQIEVGDVIVEVDQVSLNNASYHEILEQLKGEGKREVLLKVKRKGINGSERVIQVQLQREKILMEEERLTYSWEPFANGIIGKLTLPSFYESYNAPSCEKDIREALRKLKQQGNLLGLVFDCRNNLGGFLGQAIKVASLFITSGVVTIAKYAQGEVQYFRNIDPRVYYSGPLLILASKMSASAAEIVAQVLQDYGIALVAGDERTYGKGTIQYQTITDQTASSFFKVTVGKYYTVSGKSTQIEGVKADINVPTAYASYNIGEKYLEYALKNDQVRSAYVDSLSDVSKQYKPWFQKHYIPYLQKKESQWVKMIPRLKANSSHRISRDANFQNFLKGDEGGEEINISINDLQMEEAISIIKDMINLQS